MTWAMNLSSIFSLEHLELLIRIIFQIYFLIASAFYSGSEVALFGLSRLDLSKLRNSRHPMSDKIHTMLQNPRNLIISILVGNELHNIASSANMAVILMMFFSEDETRWINLVVMVPMLLLIGEVTPKTVAITVPTLIATKITARILPYWIVLVKPARIAVRFVSDRVTTMIVGRPLPQDHVVSTEVFRTLVEEGEAGGALDSRERMLVENMLDASETEVIQIMTPCTRMHTLDADQPLPKILAEFRRYKHPHNPVIRKHHNNIIGFLEAEDVQRMLMLNPDLNHLRIDDLLRPAHFVPPTKKVDEMFDYFNHNKTWAAIVLGEYGDVFGIVTIADVLGFVFGGISQKIESIGYSVTGHDKDVFIVSGDMHIKQFCDACNVTLDVPEETMISTIGGYVFELFGRLPKIGESYMDETVQFTVTEMDNLRIKTVEVKRIIVTSSHQEEEKGSNLASREADPLETNQDDTLDPTPEMAQDGLDVTSSSLS